MQSSTGSALTLKQLFIERRKAFKSNPESVADLEAYTNRDNTHDYSVLKGFIPPSLVGKEAPGGQSNWGKSDTFFSDFERNYPAQVLFDEGDELLVIGNMASHDTRQYLAKWDPDGKDRTPAAGMSYVHLMVIPRTHNRVYNAVALENSKLIREMEAYFERFWRRPDAVEKTTRWLQEAVDRRTIAVRNSLKSKDLLDEFESEMRGVTSSTKEFAAKLHQLHDTSEFVPVDELFLLGLHPAPDASIAHLHMHVVLTDADFRKFSTDAHDWKTVPVMAVIEVIDEEAQGAAARPEAGGGGARANPMEAGVEVSNEAQDNRWGDNLKKPSLWSRMLSPFRRRNTTRL